MTEQGAPFDDIRGSQRRPDASISSTGDGFRAMDSESVLALVDDPRGWKRSAEMLSESGAAVFVP